MTSSSPRKPGVLFWVVLSVVLVAIGLVASTWWIMVPCEFCGGTGSWSVSAVDPSNGEATHGKMPCGSCLYGEVRLAVVWIFKIGRVFHSRP